MASITLQPVSGYAVRATSSIYRSSRSGYQGSLRLEYRIAPSTENYDSDEVCFIFTGDTRLEVMEQLDEVRKSVNRAVFGDDWGHSAS